MKHGITLIMILIIFMAMSFDVAAKRKEGKAAATRKPAAVSAGSSRGGHVDFSDMFIEGQNKKGSAIYFLERLNRGGKSRVRKRKHFRNEIMESL